MKDTLKDIFDKFGQSKAVFVGSNKTSSVYGNEGDVFFTVKDEYNPIGHAPHDKEDPVANLVMGNYSERFVKEEGRFVKSLSMIEETRKEIFNAIKSTFVHASPLKQPHQSKFYKWFEYGIIDTPAKREGMIALYRYIRKHTDRDFRFKEGPENPHAKNVVAILEKMKEKYE